MVYEATNEKIHMKNIWSRAQNLKRTLITLLVSFALLIPEMG
jgi:hypothetical protein